MSFWSPPLQKPLDLTLCRVLSVPAVLLLGLIAWAMMWDVVGPPIADPQVLRWMSRVLGVAVLVTAPWVIVHVAMRQGRPWVRAFYILLNVVALAPLALLVVSLWLLGAIGPGR